ncbi:MAG: VTT domain-containing protein [Gammaproteobacteria bacterium]|nr:VTT domain-containing protein [Gammaproteobacteria bacterium]
MNKGAIRVLIFVTVLALIGVAAVYRDQLNVQQIQLWIDQAGFLAPLLFMVLYALATVSFFPGSFLTLLGGALFGPVLGTFYNLTGATLGAILAFLIARYLASDWVEQKTTGRARTLVKGVEAEGWRFVAFVRLVPLFPFNLLNYLLGLTRIPFLQYVIASYVFMLPGAIAYTYLGYAGREVAAGSEGLIQKGLIAMALLAVAAFLPRLVSRLRQQPMVDVETLKAKLDDQDCPVLLDVRSTDEFTGEQGHIAEARNIPLEELNERLTELGDDPEVPILVICRTDRRSNIAARQLAGSGFSQVRVVKGGMTAWLDKGWSVV